MKPRLDDIGVELDAGDIDQANMYFDTIWNNWILTTAGQLKKSRPLEHLAPDENGVLLLDKAMSAQLRGFVSMAAGVHAENYQHVSDQHEYICNHNDPTKHTTVAYLGDLEQLLEEESAELVAANSFANSIISTSIQSKTAYELKGRVAQQTTSQL